LTQQWHFEVQNYADADEFANNLRAECRAECRADFGAVICAEGGAEKMAQMQEWRKLTVCATSVLII
jgi:hypothetical protein